MKNFKHEIETALNAHEAELNGKATVDYIQVAGHTVAVLGFYFNGLAEARVDFVTFDSNGEELPDDRQGNTFGIKEVMTIMTACKTMAERLQQQHDPERIAFVGSEAKRYSLYQRLAHKLSEGKKVWTEASSLTVWVELREGW
jgi:hypothetical protein